MHETVTRDLKATSHLTIFMCDITVQKSKFKGMITNTGNAGRLLRVKHLWYL